MREIKSYKCQMLGTFFFTFFQTPHIQLFSYEEMKKWRQSFERIEKVVK